MRGSAHAHRARAARGRRISPVIATVAADPAYAGAIVNVAGPDNITFNEFTRHLVARHGDAGTTGPGRVKHISPTALRIMSVLARPVNPTLARQVATALTMDTTDMTCDTAAVHRQFPGLQRERLDDVVPRMPAGNPPGS